MTTLTAAVARRKFSQLLKRVVQEQKTFRIRQHRSAAIMLSAAKYEGLLETLELLSVPGFHASIKKSVAQMRRGETVSLPESPG
ncbi:MAG: type II toxin-antitoxin system Phd/YefM family antitoxin [Kiritimatiellaeota bacterium]|nr:type II toxin-antitoxin system Phd/YefM family antitoxin [Kiritimatiellota bacterium]